jgi:hypothetical protein
VTNVGELAHWPATDQRCEPEEGSDGRVEVARHAASLAAPIPNQHSAAANWPSKPGLQPPPPASVSLQIEPA